MDFEDDLKSPVWDELADTHQERKINSSYEEINVLEDNSKIQIQLFDHLIVNNSDNTNYHSISRTFDSQLNITMENNLNGKDLLNTLAPTANTFIDTSEIPIYTLTEEDPLFVGNDRSLIKITNQTDDSILPSSPIKRLTKANILYKSTFLHSKLSSKKKMIQNLNNIPPSDPLRISEPSTIVPDEKLDLDKKITKDSSIINFYERANNDEENTLESEDKIALIEEIENSAINFRISVSDPTKVSGITFVHIEYLITIEPNDIIKEYSKVYRRYSDIRWLYRQLQSDHWGKIIPPPPEKKVMGRFQSDFIEDRRLQIEIMLNEIARDRILQRDETFISFLSNQNFLEYKREIERRTGSAASSDSKDLSEIHISEIKLLGKEDAEIVTNSGGIDLEYRRLFWGLSFSPSLHYKETDEFFVKVEHKIELLEEHLKNLSKAITSISDEKNELINLINEFVEVLEFLPSTGIKSESNGLLNGFAETHKMINSIIDISRNEESIIFGITLDVYIRTISSIRAVLNQRAKLGYYLMIEKRKLHKLKEQSRRFDQNIHLSSNEKKIKSMKESYQVLEERCQKIGKSWVNIGNVIKLEMNKFEDKNIDDLTCNISIFLESAIQNQKKILFLWKQFYKDYL